MAGHKVIPIPDLRGMPLRSAIDCCSELGLELEVVEPVVPRMVQRNADGSNPGKIVPEGSTIRVFLEAMSAGNGLPEPALAGIVKKYGGWKLADVKTDCDANAWSLEACENGTCKPAEDVLQKKPDVVVDPARPQNPTAGTYLASGGQVSVVLLP